MPVEKTECITCARAVIIIYSFCRNTTAAVIYAFSDKNISSKNTSLIIRCGPVLMPAICVLEFIPRTRVRKRSKLVGCLCVNCVLIRLWAVNVGKTLVPELEAGLSFRVTTIDFYGRHHIGSLISCPFTAVWRCATGK